MQAVGLGFLFIQDVYDFCPAKSNQVVRDERAVAAPPQPLGAHVRDALLLCQAEQFPNALGKLFGFHVVGVVAEALVPQRDVGRVRPLLLAVAAQQFAEPVVGNPGCG